MPKISCSSYDVPSTQIFCFSTVTPYVPSSLFTSDAYVVCDWTHRASGSPSGLGKLRGPGPGPGPTVFAVLAALGRSRDALEANDERVHVRRGPREFVRGDGGYVDGRVGHEGLAETPRHGATSRRRSTDARFESASLLWVLGGDEEHGRPALDVRVEGELHDEPVRVAGGGGGHL